MLRRFAACLLLVSWMPDAVSAAEPPVVRVFLLAGQSNMEGQGVVDLDHKQHYNGGRGTLQWLLRQADSRDRWQHLRNADQSWSVRDDVFVRFRTPHGLKAGPLTIGFSGYPGSHHIGPELQFGHVVGDHFDEPVLLIKTAWGGRSLFRDFRPPSTGGATGPAYRQMLAELHEGLDSIDRDFPRLQGHRPVISGFVWMQGWNDMISQEATAEYSTNLVHLIHDVRAATGQPRLPVVVGELGNGGRQGISPGMKAFRAAQKAACERPEFSGTVLFVPTAEFARPADLSPNVGHGHHWFGNAESYLLIGDALGQAMLRLTDQPAAARTEDLRPEAR